MLHKVEWKAYSQFCRNFFRRSEWNSWVHFKQIKYIQIRILNHPVGKVESMTLYPLDFEEFLWANGEERLSQEIRSAFDLMTPLPEALHQKAIEFYRYYLIVGGMPACVQTFTNSGKLVFLSIRRSNVMRS